MKNKFIIICFLSIIAFIFVGCSKDNNVNLTGITIDSSNISTEFIIGEELAITNLKVMAQYSDDSTKEITNYTIDKTKYNKDKIGEYDILISYIEGESSFTATLKVKVIEDPNKVVLSSISIDESKIKTSYIIGDTLSLEGLVVTALYSDNTTKVVTDYTCDTSGYIASKEGSYRILISYTFEDITKVYIYTVTVASILSTVNYLVGIDVTPRNVYFLVGSDFNTNDLKVMAIYKDGSEVDVTSKVNINSTKYIKNTVGVYEIVIDYSETYGTGEAAVTIFWDSFYFARVVNELPKESE